MLRNRWPECSGMGGRNGAEWVAEIKRNIQCRIPTIMVLLIALSGAAYAAELFTPSFYHDQANLRCSIVNVSESNKTVRIQIIDADPTSAILVEDSGDFILWPGGAADISTYGGCSNGCHSVYCKFIVQGKKRNFRASGCVTGVNLPEKFGCVSAE